MERVAGQHAVADGGVGAELGAVKGIGVVVADGFQTADAGKNAFPSTAVAGHHMMGSRAKANYKVCLRHGVVDPHRRFVGRCPEIYKVLCFAVMVFHPDAVIDPVCHQRPQLLLVSTDVGAVGNHDSQIGGLDAADLQQIVHKMRHH